MKKLRTMSINEIIAKILQFMGFKPKHSTSICGNTTKGYGKLDNNGYWQFPLYYFEEE